MVGLSSFVVVFLSMFAWAFASPLEARTTLDVWIPPITSPTHHDVWRVGSVEPVTWNATSPPGLISNRALVVLQNNKAGVFLPLASNFSLLEGFVNVTVPSVPPRHDYHITLFGDSGNTSPQFAITA